VTLFALVRMKLMSWRDKDRTHLRDMIHVGLIDATWPGPFATALPTVYSDCRSPQRLIACGRSVMSFLPNRLASPLYLLGRQITRISSSASGSGSQAGETVRPLFFFLRS